jgi:hypothetical protein
MSNSSKTDLKTIVKKLAGKTWKNNGEYDAYKFSNGRKFEKKDKTEYAE